jgi:hypothetical protein
MSGGTYPMLMTPSSSVLSGTITQIDCRFIMHVNTIKSIGDCPGLARRERLGHSTREGLAHSTLLGAAQGTGG